MKTEATARPWHLGSLPPPRWRYITDDNGTVVAAVAEWDEDGNLVQEFANAEANGRFLVRAVNNFDSLLAALELARPIVADKAAGGRMATSRKTAMEVWNIIHAAIALATGKETV